MKRFFENTLINRLLLAGVIAAILFIPQLAELGGLNPNWWKGQMPSGIILIVTP